jgi:hypothetical protein
VPATAAASVAAEVRLATSRTSPGAAADAGSRRNTTTAVTAASTSATPASAPAISGPRDRAPDDDASMGRF